MKPLRIDRVCFLVFIKFYDLSRNIISGRRVGRLDSTADDYFTRAANILVTSVATQVQLSLARLASEEAFRGSLLDDTKYYLSI